MWIAIITLISSAGVAITHVDLESKDACFRVKAHMERKFIPSSSGVYQVDCFAKK
jgi:hypothetical protein